MLQKELAKRLKARYDTKMDGNEWLEVSSDGIPLCRIKYNGQFLSNADKNPSDEYRNKILDIQEEISTVREYVGLYEHAPQMQAADVSDYRQLAAFGDTVLAATYSEKNGFMFCTWKQNADGDSVFWGDYSPNYEYLKKGYSREWINQRLQAIQVRKELTDEWDARGVQKGVEYAILTDEISRAWSGMSTRQYKNLKGLKKENLRDNMTTLELVLNMLAEATTTQFSRDRKPTTFQENLAVAKAGGQVAGRTRKDIESQSDTPVITAKNAAQLNQVVTDLLEGAVSDTTEESKDK